jgi:outer membrane protein OmpA-like peptidoglycan-associated protein
MKIVAYILGILLAVGLAAAGWFFYTTVNPLIEEKAHFSAATQALDASKKELKKCREAEQKAGAWVGPAVDAIKAGLNDEIAAGKAEVAAAGGRVIVNLSEELLFMPGSVTFSKDSPQLAKLASLLKNSTLKDKEIFVGNMTQAVPARGKGKKKLPARDARTLALDRSAALVKYLEKNGVSQESLAALAYAASGLGQGFKINGKKTVLLIQTPSGAEAAGPAPKPETGSQGKPGSAPTGTTPTAPVQPKAVPVKPAP